MLLRDAILHSKEAGCTFWREDDRFRKWRYRVFPGEPAVDVPERLFVRRFPGDDFHAEPLVNWVHILATDWVCSDGWTPEEP